MTNSHRLAKVRELFLNWMLNAQGSLSTADSDQPLIRSESVLIRDEFYCGRRFHSDLYDAIWFIEEDVLKIYRGDGTLAKALRSADIDAFDEKMVVAAAAETLAESTVGEPTQQDDPQEVGLHVGSESGTQASDGEHAPSILKLHDPATLSDANQDQVVSEDQAVGGNQNDGETRRAA